MRALNISDESFITIENLIWSAHFVDVSILLIVTVVDSFDDTFNFRGLDQVKQIVFNSGSESISSLVILLEDNLGKEYFIINGLDVV